MRDLIAGYKVKEVGRGVVALIALSLPGNVALLMASAHAF